MYDVKSAYPTAKIFLGGVFNSPGINWSNSSIRDLYIWTLFRKELIEISEEFHLKQLVS